MSYDALTTVWLIARDVCLPILVMIGAGVAFDRRYKLDLETLVKLNIYLFVPAFIFVRVTESAVGTTLGFRLVAFTASMIGAMAVLSFVVGRVRSYAPEQRKTLLLTSMFYNSGNFGIPLITLAFPEAGPGIQVFVLMTMNVSTFTIGLMLASAKSCPAGRSIRFQIGPVLRQPSLYAIFAAILLKTLDVPVQDALFLWKPAEFLADALIGLALVTLGVQLSQTRRTRCHGPLAWALAIRLIGGPLCAVGLTALFGFDQIVTAVLILGSTAPTAVNTALLAHEFRGDSETAAAAVFYSTGLSFLSVGVILLWLRIAWAL